MATDRAPFPRRRVLRLSAFDYSSPGAYFVTICAPHMRRLFGSISDGEVLLSDAGAIVHDEWLGTARRRTDVELDEFVVMPNHFHGIVVLRGDEQRPSHLGAVVGGFKAACTGRVRVVRAAPQFKLWQRGYYEHVVRNEAALARIRTYVRENPLRWWMRWGAGG